LKIKWVNEVILKDFTEVKEKASGTLDPESIIYTEVVAGVFVYF
jgi:hypothetical protein